MKNSILISTGTVYFIDKDINKEIAILKEFNPDGYELSFHTLNDLLKSNLTYQSANYLASLKCNTIHAPFKGVRYGSNEASQNALIKLFELYDEINAKNIVFHTESIFDYKCIQFQDCNTSIENNDLKMKDFRTCKQAKEFIKSSNLKLTLDIAHAYQVYSMQPELFMTNLQDRIVEYHASIITEGRHYFIYQNPKTAIINALKLASPDTPVIIESSPKNVNELAFLKNEIKFLKEL